MQLSRLFLSLRWVLLCGVLGTSLLFAVACGKEDTNKPECQVTEDCVKSKGPNYYCDKRRLICRQAACTSDADCNNGEVCQTGSCIPQSVVTDGGDTEGNTSTDGGTTDGTAHTDGPPTDTAGGSCTTDADCGSQICQTNCTAENVSQCVNGQCVAGAQPCQCATGFQCSQATGQCEADVCPGNQPRLPDGKCPEEKCKDAKCGAGQTPDPDNNCQCIQKKDWCSVCTRDAECGLNGKCVADSQGNKFCAEDCSVSRSCSDNAKYSCLTLGQNKAVCMPVSGSCPCLGTQCPAGQQCCLSDGLCHECCGDSDCTSPQVCRADGTCGAKDKCTGVQCQPGQQCNSNTGQCECQSPCPTGTCCDPNGNRCTAAACGSSGNQCTPACQAGQQCCDVLGQKQCLPQCPGGTGGSCKLDSDCKSGEMCCNLMGLGASCMQANPILKPLCGGSSSGACQSNADCSSGQQCCPGLLPILPKSCKATCN